MKKEKINSSKFSDYDYMISNEFGVSFIKERKRLAYFVPTRSSEDDGIEVCVTDENGTPPHELATVDEFLETLVETMENYCLLQAEMLMCY